MDVTQLAKRLSLTLDKKTATKAAELVRLVAVRTGGSAWAQGESTKNATCLEIACKLCGESGFDRSVAARLCGVSNKVYDQTLTAVQNVLQINVAPGIKDLSVTFGCPQIADFATSCLKIFKSRYLESLPEYQRQNAELTQPSYIAAAFYLAARKRKVICSVVLPIVVADALGVSCPAGVCGPQEAPQFNGLLGTRRASPPLVRFERC